MHFVLDNSARIRRASAEPFLISSLSEGRHSIRVFPVKRTGESVKDSSAFAMRQFFVRKNNTGLINPDLPTLTYSEPAGFYKGESAKRVLLDFLVANAILSEKGYMVVYSIDGIKRAELFAEKPVYLTNLAPGIHTVMLELVDKQGKLAEGNFVRTQHDIIILEKLS